MFPRIFKLQAIINVGAKTLIIELEKRPKLSTALFCTEASITDYLNAKGFD
jgi:hypothetical protein